MKVVVLRFVKVNEPDQITPAVPVFLIGNLNSFSQHPVKGFVIGNQFGGVKPFYLFDGIFPCVCGNVRVDAGNSVF